MIIRLSVIKTVHSNNDKISEQYEHNFLNLLKVKGMNSIPLFSLFLFFNQAIHLNTVILYCTSLIIITTVCELQSLILFCEQFAFQESNLDFQETTHALIVY